MSIDPDNIQYSFNYIFKETSMLNPSYLKVENIPYLLYENMCLDINGLIIKIHSITPPTPFVKSE